MKDIPVVRGRRFIMEAIAQGEHLRQDFKYAISDARKIARSLSAFANAQGGRLLIGVKDNGVVAGVRNEEDIYMVELAAERYCYPPQHVEFTAFRVDSALVVIRAEVSSASERPVFVHEADGQRKAYFRVADENILAHPLMVRAWQNTGGLSLTLDADSLRVLELLRGAPEGYDVRSLALAAHMSQRRLEGMIVDLVSAGVVDFEYHAPEFRIIASKDPDTAD